MEKVSFIASWDSLLYCSAFHLEKFLCPSVAAGVPGEKYIRAPVIWLLEAQCTNSPAHPQWGPIRARPARGRGWRRLEGELIRPPLGRLTTTVRIIVTGRSSRSIILFAWLLYRQVTLVWNLKHIKSLSCTLGPCCPPPLHTLHILEVRLIK